MDGTVDYHFVLAVLTHTGRASTRSGILSISPTTTRHDVFEHLLTTYWADEPEKVVQFFSLEPNQLGGAA